MCPFHLITSFSALEAVWRSELDMRESAHISIALSSILKVMVIKRVLFHIFYYAARKLDWTQMLNCQPWGRQLEPFPDFIFALITLSASIADNLRKLSTVLDTQVWPLLCHLKTSQVLYSPTFPSVQDAPSRCIASHSTCIHHPVDKLPILASEHCCTCSSSNILLQHNCFPPVAVGFTKCSCSRDANRHGSARTSTAGFHPYRRSGSTNTRGEKPMQDMPRSNQGQWVIIEGNTLLTVICICRNNGLNWGNTHPAISPMK